MSDPSEMVRLVKTINEISKFDRSYWNYLVAGVNAIHDNPGSMLALDSEGGIYLAHHDGMLERVAAFEGLPIPEKPRSN